MSLDFNHVFPYIAEIIGCTMFVCLSIPLKYIKIDPIYKLFIVALVLSSSTLIYIISTQQSEKIKFNLLQDITDHNHIIQSLVYTTFIIGMTIGFQYLPVSIVVPLEALVTPFGLIFNKFVNNVEPTLYQILGGVIAFIGIVITSFQREKIKLEYLYGIIATIIGSAGLAYVNSVSKNHIPSNITNILFKNNVEIFNNTYISVIILGIIAIVYGVYKRVNVSLVELGKLIASLFFFQYIGYQFVHFAYNKLPENNFMELLNVEMIISFIIGYFVFGENINIKKIIGIIIIALGIFLGIKP